MRPSHTTSTVCRPGSARLWLIALLVLSASLVHARIGESKYKCDSRYGKPTKTKTTPIKPAEKAYTYKVDGTYLVCHFSKGKCVAIQVRTIREKITKALREANGKDWQHSSGKWQTKDGSRVAVEVYSPVAGFAVYDGKFYKLKAKAKKSPKF